MRRAAALIASVVLAGAVALAPGAPAQDGEVVALPHFAGAASGALLLTPPSDPAAVGLPALPLPTNPRQASTRAEVSTTGFDGDAAVSRAEATTGGRSVRQSAHAGDDSEAGEPARGGAELSARARPVAATGPCPPADADGLRLLADAEARAGNPIALGLLGLGRTGATRSSVALVPAPGQDGLAVRATAETAIGTLRLGPWELRVVEQARLEAEASGRDGGATIRWQAPVIEVAEVATGRRIARLDADNLSFRTPDESEFGGRNQPLRIALAAPDEQITSPDGGFARARAALLRIRFQPSFELGEITIGALEASATAPPGGVATCDGGAPRPPERTRPHVLIYEGNEGFEHVARHEANRTLGRLANRTGDFSFEITDQATFLRDDRLAGVDMVLFNNNVGNMPVDAGQKAALERHLLAGRGAGGIHSSTDANYEWDEYGEMFGARFDQHPHIGYLPELAARVVVEDESSPMTRPWHDAPRGRDGRRSFMWADEYYRWRAEDVPALRADPDVNVLLSLDTKTVLPGTQLGLNPYGAYRVEFQPIAWTKTFRGKGRVFYTNMGHNGFGWADPALGEMVLEGIRWVTESVPR